MKSKEARPPYFACQLCFFAPVNTSFFKNKLYAASPQLCTSYMISSSVPVLKSKENIECKPALIFNDTDSNKRVLSTIQRELKHSSKFSFSVAFVTTSGLSCLKQQLIDSKETIKGRILTTDYLNFSDPRALRDLLKFNNIQVRMYTKENFHTKGYLFYESNKTTLLIGSSNITQDALNKNKEWNVKITSDDLENKELIKQTESEFEKMWEDSEILTEEWIKNYEPRHIKSKIERDRQIFTDERYPNIIKPNSMQEEALQNLAKIRSEGKKKALLVSATGTGKTYLSAFDVRESGAKKVLFLVHREQILDDARRSYQNILGPNVKTGKISGTCKDYDANIIFSTIQSMSRKDVIEHFKPNHFEYIICDEAHHATASTYNRIIEHFQPKFMLGMTATPERMDTGDVFQRFDHNIAYEIRLQDALRKEMLCPFHYYGVTDITINGRVLEDDEDINSLTTDERVKQIIEKADLYGYSGDRVKGLIFCSRKDEAKEISEKMNAFGLRTQFLSGEDNMERREECVRKLEQDENNENALDYIVTVDIFNEGVDIKSINQIIMLRPTESTTIFIQQLGRGLRKMTRDNKTKEFLVVIDFIGNYKSNFLIPMALTGDATMSKENLKRRLMTGNESIPGCSTVDFDPISKEKIFDSINRTTSLVSIAKNTYKTLVKMLGYEPDLRYLYKNSKIDPEVIIDKYGSLNNFKEKLNLNSIDFDENEDSTLKFISKSFIDGMRPHELIILNDILEKGSITLDSFEEQLNIHGVEFDQDSLDSAISILSGTYSDELKGNKLISINGGEIEISDYFKKCISNPYMKESIIDVIECGLSKFDNEYRNTFDGRFTPFKRYSRADVCRLLNWNNKNESVTIYGYRVKKNTCPMFVTYRKDESISKSTLYEDRFIDRKTFSWMTRSNVSLDGKEVPQILNPDCKSYLFVKKDDDDSSKFYYMGEATPIRESVKQTTIENDEGKMLPIVNIPFRLKSPVPEDIYDYITGQ